ELAMSRDGKTIFYNDLWALQCFTAAVTTDEGASNTATPLGCSHPPADRQWMGVYDPAPSDQTVSPYKGKTPLLYLSYNNTVNGAQLARSPDGRVFTGITPYATGTAAEGGASEADGNLVIDQHTGDVLATVGLPGKADGQFGLGLAVGVPDAAGDVKF